MRVEAGVNSSSVQLTRSSFTTGTISRHTSQHSIVGVAPYTCARIACGWRHAWLVRSCCSCTAQLHRASFEHAAALCSAAFGERMRGRVLCSFLKAIRWWAGGGGERTGKCCPEDMPYFDDDTGYMYNAKKVDGDSSQVVCLYMQ